MKKMIATSAVRGKLPLLHPDSVFGKIPFNGREIIFYYSPEAFSGGCTIEKSELLSDLALRRELDQKRISSKSEQRFRSNFAIAPEDLSEHQTHVIIGRGNEPREILILHEIRHALIRIDPSMKEIIDEQRDIKCSFTAGYEDLFTRQIAQGRRLRIQRNTLIGNGSGKKSPEVQAIMEQKRKLRTPITTANWAMSCFLSRLTPEELIARVGSLCDIIGQYKAEDKNCEIGELQGWISIENDAQFLRSAPDFLPMGLGGKYGYFAELASMIESDAKFQKKLRNFHEHGGRLHSFFANQSSTLSPIIRKIATDCLRQT
jgi:hypothetical protein